MKMKLFRAAAAAVCVSLCAATLTGCMAPLGIGQSIGESIGKSVGESVRGSVQNWAGISGIAESVAAGLPTVDKMLSYKDNPNDHRETVTVADQEERTELVLTLNDSSQVFLKQGGEEFQFEYDPAYFTVEPAYINRRMFLTVSMLKARGMEEENYKCILTLPDRDFDKIKVESNQSGIAFLDIASPLEVTTTESGMAFTNPRSDVDIKDSSGAFSADIAADYAHTFRYDGSDCAFSVRFPEGQPEGLRFRAAFDPEDSLIVRPSEWLDSFDSFDYNTGDKAYFDFTLENATGAITVE